MTGRRGSADRLARVAWSRLSEPEDVAVSRRIVELGHEGALRRLQEGSLPEAPRFRARLAALDPEGDVARAARVGARLLVPGDAQWPAGVDDLDHPPHCLWVQGPGDLAQLMARSVSVVGARAATSYGENQAVEIAGGVSDRGMTVVSGAAFGIDAAAHRGALAAEAPTVAVLACGLDRAYPSAHADLLGRIAATGAVVSELPVGSAPFRQRFLSRNRLIATLTRGTVVVEAGLRSGSLNTARTAAAHGRVVMAVPGPVTSMVSAGCHAAVRDGVAILVTDAADVLDAVGDLGADAAPARRGPDRPGDDLEGPVRAVFDALPVRRAATVEALAVATTLPEADVVGALGELELLGLARRTDRGWQRPRQRGAR